MAGFFMSIRRTGLFLSALISYHVRIIRDYRGFIVSLILRFHPVYSCIYNSQSSLFVSFILIVSRKIRHTFALSPRQRRSRLFTEIIRKSEQRKLLSTRRGRVCGFKLSYFRKLMMRRAIPMYKPTGKLCFSKKDESGRFPYGCPYLLTGGNRGGSRTLSGRTEVSNLFIHIKKNVVWNRTGP